MLKKVLRLLFAVTIIAVAVVGIYLLITGLLSDNLVRILIGIFVLAFCSSIIETVEKKRVSEIKQSPPSFIKFFDEIEEKISRPVKGWSRIFTWVWVIILFLIGAFVLSMIPATQPIAWVPLLIAFILMLVFVHLLAARVMSWRRIGRKKESVSDELPN